MKIGAQLLLLISITITLCACSVLNNNINPKETPNNQVRTEPTFESFPGSTTNNLLDSEQIKEDINNTQDEEEIELRQKQKRQGELDLSKIQTIGVEGELLNTILSLFKALDANDDEARLKLVYDPAFDELKDRGPYILNVVKLELDETRVSDVIKEYALSTIADEVKIVKISMGFLDDNLVETIGTGDFIFICINDNWKYYRLQ